MGSSFSASVEESAKLALNARIEILKMTHHSKASHVGSALSVVDILATIYSTVIVSVPEGESPNENKLILSKGHAASALYSILSLKGYFDSSWLKEYCGDGAQLGGHVTSIDVPGVELSTGSLGHGLPYGMGIALGKKMNSNGGAVFVIMSDGECDEGTTWESALIASHFNLSNLVVVIDRNRIQSLAGTEETIRLEPFASKWKSFGWKVLEVDGHNYEKIEEAVLTPKLTPTVIIANTTKGKGVSFMENSVVWHYRSPSDGELKFSLEELAAPK